MVQVQTKCQVCVHPPNLLLLLKAVCRQMMKIVTKQATSVESIQQEDIRVKRECSFAASQLLMRRRSNSYGSQRLTHAFLLPKAVCRQMMKTINKQASQQENIQQDDKTDERECSSAASQD